MVWFAILKKMSAHLNRRSTLTFSFIPCVNLLMTFSIISEKSHTQEWRQMQKSQLHTMYTTTSRECLWHIISVERPVKSLELYPEVHNRFLPSSECSLSTSSQFLLRLLWFLLFSHIFSHGNFL